MSRTPIDLEKLDELLKQAKMSRRMLARLSGINYSKMSMWFCSQVKTIRTEDLIAMANALGVQPQEIAKDNLPGVPEWIRVKDRLPEKYNRVLISAVDDESNTRQATTIGFLEGDWWWSQESGGSDAELGVTVTHWMPLPEPPEEDDGE